MTRTPLPTSTSGIRPEDIEKLKKELAAYIGPMARVLVARAVKAGAPLEQIYTSLAAEIPSEKDRAKFLSSRTRG